MSLPTTSATTKSQAEGQEGPIVNVLTRVRAFIGAPLAILLTLFTAIVIVVVGALNLVDFQTRLMRGWARILLFLFGIKVVYAGEEYLPSSGGGIIVFNHQSHFDIPVIMLTTPKKVRFGAKIELFRIPFFGAAMKAVGTLPIARENRNEVLRTYKEAEERFRENTLFVLAPEGTRQAEPKIGRFKKGPFLFAVNAGVPVIPCVIKNAHLVLPKNSLSVNIGRKTRTIQVEFLPPVPTKGLTTADMDSIVQNVREGFVETYQRLPSEA